MFCLLPSLVLCGSEKSLFSLDNLLHPAVRQDEEDAQNERWLMILQYAGCENSRQF
jgi:hypothetical protein